MQLLLLLTTAQHAVPSASASACLCLIVRDETRGQDVKIEAWGRNAVRVRAVPSGSAFKDTPDIVSALVPQSPTTTTTTQCCTVSLPAYANSATGSEPAAFASHNLKASVGTDGRLRFTRLSDGKVLLSEAWVRKLVSTTTTPPVLGFSSLDMAFDPVADERIYGLGQHAAFPWDKNFPQNGQLNQKGVPVSDCHADHACSIPCCLQNPIAV